MRRSSLFLSLGLVALSLVGQAPSVPVVHGIDPANLDTSVKPCEDFYDYANGGWLKRTQIPADKARYGGFEELIERNRAVLHGILDSTSAKRDWKKGSPEQQVGDFYASGMNEALIEKKGLSPLAPDLAVLRSLKTAQDLPAVLAKLNDLGYGGPFRCGVGVDRHDAKRYQVGLGQAGLGMPDRDYYLKDDARSKGFREKYQIHVQKMLQLAGDKPARAKAEAETIMKLETQLAQISWSRVENRNPNKTDNKTAVSKLAADAPGFDWAAYLQGRGFDVAELNVAQPSFAKAFGEMAKSVTPEQWRTYLRWHLIRTSAPALPKAFVEESFNFRGRVLSGVTEQEPRWKRVQAAVDGSIGESLGQLYVKKAFSPEAKAKVLDMITNMREALKERIQGLDWMGAETKTQAIRKLDAFMVKMAYPDTWRVYDFEVKRDDYFGNLRRAARFEIHRDLARLKQPVDRTEWTMTPPTVNAYYNPSLNEIVFPAGILQAPFFDPMADDAVNYGGIGVVIGHEMSHGFDDQGSKYDGDGNLNNWWTDADRQAYEARTALLAKQFDGYEPLPGEHINGKLTLGENIGDLGGLKIAYAAWKRSLRGQEAPVINGLTGPQRFFLGFATVWREHTRPEEASVRLKTDPHSPGRYRVMGPLSDLPEFYQAFGCKDGDPMLRPEAERPSIW